MVKSGRNQMRLGLGGRENPSSGETGSVYRDRGRRTRTLQTEETMGLFFKIKGIRPVPPFQGPGCPAPCVCISTSLPFAVVPKFFYVNLFPVAVASSSSSSSSIRVSYSGSGIDIHIYVDIGEDAKLCQYLYEILRSIYSLFIPSLRSQNFQGNEGIKIKRERERDAILRYSPIPSSRVKKKKKNVMTYHESASTYGEGIPCNKSPYPFVPLIPSSFYLIFPGLSLPAAVRRTIHRYVYRYVNPYCLTCSIKRDLPQPERCVIAAIRTRRILPRPRYIRPSDLYVRYYLICGTMQALYEQMFGYIYT